MARWAGPSRLLQREAKAIATTKTDFSASPRNDKQKGGQTTTARTMAIEVNEKQKLGHDGGSLVYEIGGAAVGGEAILGGDFFEGCSFEVFIGVGAFLVG
jgi:hypothetical protein